MPDFTFTSPEGKSYTVSGPEGATKDQAFQVLQQQLSAGTAKEDSPPAAAPAAQPQAPTNQRVKDAIAGLQSENPLNKLGPMSEPTPSPTLASAAKAVAGSTAFGGVAGALSPEIVTGIGLAVSAIPVVGEVAGPALVATGQAMRGLRGAAALAGAVSGAVGETAGQGAEALGANKGQADAARLVGGMLTPGAGALAGFVPHAMKGAWDIARKVLGQEASVPKAVEVARENLAKLAEKGQPETAMHAMLQKGVEADRQAAEKAGDAVVADAHKRAGAIAQSDAATANRLVDEARTRAEQLKREAAQRAATLEKASDGKMATASQVLAKSAPELAKVGQVQELSDIGTTIRQAVTVKQGEQIAARNEAYNALKVERDAAVEAKQKAGQTIDETPSMAALKKDLKSRLGATKGLQNTVDPGVRQAYQQVLTALERPQATEGVASGLLDASGKPIAAAAGKTGIDFKAIDDLRRRLGEVAAGQQVEGYAAIGKQNAQRMYAQLAKAQEEFAGPIQKQMQSGYSEATGDLAKFGSAGKKATAVDRLDPERFAADPKTLPGHFFNSRQGVQDLKELTGNPQLVERQASDYAARSMQGMSSKQAANWVRENRDWMREIPGLTERSQQYAQKLQQIERVGGKLGKRAEALSKDSAAVREQGTVAAEKERQAGTEQAARAAEGSVATQKRVIEEGQKAGDTTKAEAFAPAKGLEGILKGDEAPAAVKNLLLNGKPEQTRLAARHLATQPGGQKVLEQSVRQTLRNMNEGNLREQWTMRVRPMLQEGKMIPPERLQALETDVNRLLNSYKGKDKLSLVQRHIAAALGVAAGANF